MSVRKTWQRVVDGAFHAPYGLGEVKDFGDTGIRARFFAALRMTGGPVSRCVIFAAVLFLLRQWLGGLVGDNVTDRQGAVVVGDDFERVSTVGEALGEGV